MNFMNLIELPTVEIEPIEELEKKEAPQSSSGFLDREKPSHRVLYSGFLD